MMTLKNIAQEILSINENISYLVGLGYECRIGGIEGMRQVDVLMGQLALVVVTHGCHTSTVFPLIHGKDTDGLAVHELEATVVVLFLLVQNEESYTGVFEYLIDTKGAVPVDLFSACVHVNSSHDYIPMMLGRR